MKKEVEVLKQNTSLIENDLMPNIKQIMDTNTIKSKEGIEQNIKKIDEFQKAIQE